MIEAEGEVTIDNPTNYFTNAMYTFNYIGDSSIPEGGFIQIDFPNEVSLSETTSTLGNCTQLDCTVTG
jgi:hypothetical protein